MVTLFLQCHRASSGLRELRRGPEVLGGQPPPPSWHRAQEGAQVPLVVPATDPVLGALDPLPLCPTSVSKLKPSSGRRRKAGAAGGRGLTSQHPDGMKVPSTLSSRAGSGSEKEPSMGLALQLPKL